MLAVVRDQLRKFKGIFVVSTMKLALNNNKMITFNSVYFMPLKESTIFRIAEFNGPMDILKEVTKKQGLSLSKSSYDSNTELILKGFSEDYSESLDQITCLLETIGVPEHVYQGYQFYNDRICFEAIEFSGTTVLLSNFLSSHTWRPKWAQFKFTGEIVNHGDEIYEIKLPRFKQDYTFVYRITEDEYNSFSHCHYHSFAFDDGIFFLLIEFPPVFLLKGFAYAVDFLEHFLEINGFDLTDFGEEWFPGEHQVKPFYL